MGQRSQIYVRYNNGENLVAYHLQWNYGRFMINRAFQLLDYINKNIQDDYSIFKSKNFDFVNRDYRDREDLKVLKALIEINLDVGSIVSGHDLIEESLWYRDEVKEEFKLSPEHQDNNNGILVIDIVEDGENTVLKYGLTKGYEGLSEGEDGEYKIVSALDYFEAYENDFDYYLDKAETEEEKLEIIGEREKIRLQAELIDENYTLMTQEDYSKIFDKKYSYENCLSNDALEECKKAIENRAKQYEYFFEYVVEPSDEKRKIIIKAISDEKAYEKANKYIEENRIKAIAINLIGRKTEYQENAEREYLRLTVKDKKFSNWYEEKVFEDAKLLINLCGYELNINDNNTFYLSNIDGELTNINDIFLTIPETINYIKENTNLIEDKLINHILDEIDKNSVDINSEFRTEIFQVIHKKSYFEISNKIDMLINLKPQFINLSSISRALKIINDVSDLKELTRQDLIDKFFKEENIKEFKRQQCLKLFKEEFLNDRSYDGMIPANSILIRDYMSSGIIDEMIEDGILEMRDCEGQAYQLTDYFREDLINKNGLDDEEEM